MRYNEEQLQAAEYIIKYIKDGGSCVDKDDMMRDLYEHYDYSDLPNIVLDFLEEDGVIAYKGRYAKLTPMGGDVARYGLKAYDKKLAFKEKFKLAQDVVALISSIIGILSFFLGYIVASL